MAPLDADLATGVWQTATTSKTRGLFRAEASPDDTTWVRGRGWGLGMGAGAVRYYRTTNPVLATIGLRSINEAIADYQLTG